ATPGAALRTEGAGAGVSGTACSVGRSSNSKASIVWGLSSSVIEKSSGLRPRTRAPLLSRTTTVTRTSDTADWKITGGGPGPGARWRGGGGEGGERPPRRRRDFDRGSEPEPHLELHRPHRARLHDLPVGRRVHGGVDGEQRRRVEDVVGQDAEGERPR